MKAETLAELRTAAAVEVLMTPLEVVSVLLFLRVIQRITHMQQGSAKTMVGEASEGAPGPA